MTTVSVVIPSRNRYETLVDAIESVRLQTCPASEIIVMDDNSSDPRYKAHSPVGVTVLRRETSTVEEFGFPAPGVVRNVGMRAATGEYIAFCDDDDVWLPWKLERQLQALQNTGCRMSSTEGYMVRKRWDSGHLVDELQSCFHRRHPLYNREYYWPILKRLCRLEDDFPAIWNREFLSRHNTVITSSVIFHRSLLPQTGEFGPLVIGREDEHYWLRLLEHTDSVYVKTPCFGYCSRRREATSALPGFEMNAGFHAPPRLPVSIRAKTSGATVPEAGSGAPPLS